MLIKNKTLFKRILAAAAGILIILGLLLGISSVTGNPLFAAIAQSWPPAQPKYLRQATLA